MQQTGMRREEDIVNAVKEHAREAIRDINKAPPKIINLRLWLYWTKDEVFEVERQYRCDVILQELLEGKDFDGTLREYAHRTVATARPEGIDPSSLPIAITLSMEARMATQVKQLPDGKREVRGFPVFVVAGKGESSRTVVQMYPIGFVGVDVDLRKIDRMPPKSLTKRVEAMEELTTDFLQPFFDGLKQPAPAEGFKLEG